MKNLIILPLLALLPTFAVADIGNEVVLENGGLNNVYRIVLSDYSPDDEGVSGALEISSYDPEKTHTRIPFVGTIRFVDDGPDEVELSPDVLVSFYPPADLLEPNPKMTGFYYGRGTAEPGMSLQVWGYDHEAGKWASYSISFGKVPEEGAAGGEPADSLANESLGGIRLGDPANLVKEKIGEGIFVGEESFMAATGEYAQPWIAPDQGLEFMMCRLSKDEEYGVGSISASNKSTWKTARGIGIGDARSVVVERYKDIPHEDPNEPVAENEMIVGSIYGGLIFSFDDAGKVSDIFLGAAAE